MTPPCDWLTAAEARLAAATAGPWKIYAFARRTLRYISNGDDEFIGTCYTRTDAAFIAAAPTDLRRALAVCRAAERVATRRTEGSIRADLVNDHLTTCAQVATDERYTVFIVNDYTCDCGMAALRAALTGEEV